MQKAASVVAEAAFCFSGVRCLSIAGGSVFTLLRHTCTAFCEFGVGSVIPRGEPYPEIASEEVRFAAEHTGIEKEALWQKTEEPEIFSKSK